MSTSICSARSYQDSTEQRVQDSFDSPPVERAEQPKTTVRAIIDAPILRHSSFPGTLEDVRTVIRGNESAYVIERFTAGLGSLTGTAVQNELLQNHLTPTANPSALGVIEAEHWMPTRFTLQGEAENVQVQWTESSCTICRKRNHRL